MLSKLSLKTSVVNFQRDYVKVVLQKMLQSVEGLVATRTTQIVTETKGKLQAIMSMIMVS